MGRIEVTVPGSGIRWWLGKHSVATGTRVEASSVICVLEMTTGVFRDDAEAEVELEAQVAGIIEWAEIPEGSVLVWGQVISWIVDA